MDIGEVRVAVRQALVDVAVAMGLGRDLVGSVRVPVVLVVSV